MRRSCKLIPAGRAGFFLAWSNYPTIHASFRPDLVRDGELPRLPRGTLPATGHPLLRTSPERVLFFAELAVNASAPTAAAWIRSAVGFLGSTAFASFMLALLHGA